MEKDTIEQSFGKVLRELRKDAKVSQEELASRCQLDRTFISMLERGKRQPTLTTMISLSKALEVSFVKMAEKIEEIV